MKDEESRMEKAEGGMVKSIVQALLLLFILHTSSFILEARAATSSGAGSTAASFLEIGVGARAAGMGEANTAWADDVYGLYYNPAGVARAPRYEAGFVHNNLYSGEVAYNYLGYIHPLQYGGTLGLNLTYLDLGTVRRTTIASGTAGTFLGSASAHDFSVGLTYARPFRSFLDLGGAIKVISEGLDNHTANAVAVDIGAKWRPPVQGLTLGLAVQNMGSSLKFVREADDLPLSVRIGGAYRNTTGIWGITSDVVWVTNQDVEAKVGGEVWIWPEHFALRAGFNSANDATRGGATAGAAFRWDDLAVDYAFTPYGDLGNGHQVSLTYQFGDVRRAPGGAVTHPQPSAPAPAAQEPAATRPVAPVPVVTAPVAAPIVAQPDQAFYAMPFRFQSGDPKYAWIGNSIPTVFHHLWQKSGLVAASPIEATYTVEGDYYVVDNMLIITAKLMNEGYEAKSFQWRGDVTKAFLVFDDMVQDVNNELNVRGAAVPAASYPRTRR